MTGPYILIHKPVTLYTRQLGDYLQPSEYLTVPILGFDGPAELPHIGWQTQADMPIPTINGYSRTVKASGGDYASLQAALNASATWDTNLNHKITVDAGMQFTSIMLPARASGTGWVWVTSAGAIAAVGIRQTSTTGTYKIVPSGMNAPCITGPGAGNAHHYRITGADIEDNGSHQAWFLVDTAPASTTHHIVLDRCYMVGTDYPDYPATGVQMRGAYIAVINSYIAGIVGVGGDRQAVCVSDGPGPVLIDNNYLSAATENLMVGGSGTAYPQYDLTITRNHIYKPTSWRSHSEYVVKNLLELKKGGRVLIEGNILENSWADDQWGHGYIGQAVKQTAGDFGEVLDVTFRYNIFKHCNMFGRYKDADDSYHIIPPYPPLGDSKRISVHDNVGDDINSSWGVGQGYDGVAINISRYQEVMSFRHNTILNNKAHLNLSYAGATPYVTGQFIFLDNIMGGLNALYDGPIWAENIGYNQTVLDSATVFGGGIDYRKNMVVMTSAANNSFSSTTRNNNLFQTAWANVLFQNYNNGNGGDYHLQTGSPGHNASTDTPPRDVGANIDAVNTATAGCVSGSW